MNEAQFRIRIMPLHKRLFAYALSILGDESDAADCMQETMTKLWEHRSKIEKIDNIEAYALTTVRNLAVNAISRRRRLHDRFSEPPPDLTDLTPNPVETMENRENLRAVSAMLHTLPENQRKVVVLSAVSGLSNNEIREVTGLSDDNVRVLLSRGRKKLKQLFANFLKDGSQD